MSLAWPNTSLAFARRCTYRIALLALPVLAGAGVVSCGGATPVIPPTLVVGNITITNGSFQIERGYHQTLNVVVRSTTGVTMPGPVVCRSLNETILTVDPNCRVFAADTGVTGVIASTLGVNSPTITVRIVYQGPAKIASVQFTPPSAANPGATADSLRALVSDRLGNPVPNARVAFAVTAGGGTISPAIAVTRANGIASAEWKLGTTLGLNSATATVLGENDVPFAFVSPNVTTYSITTFNALAVADGDAQTGVILAALPVKPAVKLLDSLGKPRPGIPVRFTPTGGGRVVSTVVSTGVDGVASPGNWTLGDIPGDQSLIAKVDLATITLHATATGTPVHFQPLQISAGAFATCALNADFTVSCFGEQPKVGDSTTVNRSVPTPTKTSAHFKSVVGGMSNPSHYCAVATDASLYCWGVNSLTDTVPGPKQVFTTVVPTHVPSPFSFAQVAPGASHNCALGVDQNVYCWGSNTSGQLGDSKAPTNHFAPGVVSGGFKFSSVTSGSLHTCGVTVDGLALCWGSNANGQLGNGTTTPAASPTAVSAAGVVFTAIGAGDSFTCGLTNAGAVYCWGNLGTGGTVTSTPKTYATAPVFTSLSVGGGHTCALTADGTAYCWGNNTQGQLGDSTAVERLSPTAVATTLKFKAISAGYFHTCGSTLDGSVACWGLNSAGELGDSTAVNRLQPRFIVTSVLP